MLLLFNHFRTFLLLVALGISVVGTAQKRVLNAGIYSDSVFLSEEYALEIPREKIEFELAKEDLSPRRKFILYYLLGLRAMAGQQNSRALRYFEQCESMNRDSRQRTRNMAVVAYNHAMAVDPNDSRKILQLLVQADSMLLADFDPDLFASVRYSIAEEYRIAGRLKTALKWVREGEKILWLRTGKAHETLWVIKASLFNQLGDRTHDKIWYLRASNTLDAIRNRNEIFRSGRYKPRILAELGVAASNLGQSERAMNYYYESMEISRRNGDSSGVCNQLVNVLHEEFKLKHYDAVIALGKSLVQRCKANGLATRILEIYLLINRVYEQRGDYAKANHYLKLYIATREQQMEQSYVVQMEAIGEKHRLAQREAQLKRTSEEKAEAEQLKQEKERQLSYMTTALSAVAILLLVLGIFTFQFNRAKRRIEEQSTRLEANNEQLTRLIGDKEFLFKELHHRVKNNFQLILGFLRLQEKYAAGISTHEFIKQSEMKMNAMSMVHEMLYSGEKTEEIDLRLYLQELADSILNTLSNDAMDAEAEVRGSSIAVTIDKAIPIGLVTNEILINSLKYADEDELEIIIELRDEGDRFSILIRDNGIGFPEHFNPEMMNSLGSRAILLLMKQIDADVSWKNDEGASWKLTIPY